MSEKCKKSSFKDKSLSLTHQKNFTQTNIDAIENFEKVTQVQWKSFVKFVFKTPPPPPVLHKNTKILYTQERKIKSKITNLMLTTVHHWRAFLTLQQRLFASNN